MAGLQTQFVYGTHGVDPDQTIGHLIQTMPKALSFLIGIGFTPLANPILRERMASKVTIRQAAETLPINLERLLVDLDRLGRASEPAPRSESWPLNCLDW